ncbi:MAG: hypothetical protein PHI27_06475 [Eubacteriales bacterium]|nr:hypothetical protein [Eubacteriales bacterium]MDD3881880.1 hypothetical protein [Eubacteriales bacterium]MDD4512874.1 hypothetical protein [Eubacteriales bacterium]
MAHNRMKWKDHVVERPKTYTETTNGDGSKTFTAAPGEIIQQGTPNSATNFNHLEEGIGDVDAAFNLLYVLAQAERRDFEARIAALETSVATLVSAATT